MAEASTAPRVGGRGRALLLSGILLQAAVLLGLIGLRLVGLWRGETVLLRVVPVDPRDLLRGDYVTLGYECSRLPRGGVQGTRTGSTSSLEGQTVYVPLARDPDGRHWHGEGCTALRPAGGTFLRGRIEGGRIVFGIESYFVQEGKGKSYEAAVRVGRLWAEVAVTPEGDASLRKLVIE
jgi:uncharacterized membrane-anchored protein